MEPEGVGAVVVVGEAGSGTTGVLTMEPGQLKNMLILLAVLVAQAPPSCWLNDVASMTVAAVEVGEEVRAARGALSTRGAAGGR